MGQIRVKVGSKIQKLGTSCLRKIQVFQNILPGICAIMRSSCGQKFRSIWYCLLELLPQNATKWAQLGPE